MKMFLAWLAVIGMVIFVLAMVKDRDRRSERERLLQQALADKNDEIERLREGRL